MNIFAPIPDKWFWDEWRIPRNLINIEEGSNFVSFYILEFIQRRICNPQDLNRYYNKIYVGDGE